MANGGSAYLENAILQQYLVAGCYVSLHTGSASAGLNEVSGAGYSRQSPTWNVSGSQPTTAVNNAIFDFPVATGNWGIISAVGIWDSLSGGHLLFYGDVVAPTGINTGDVARFNAGALSVAAA